MKRNTSTLSRAMQERDRLIYEAHLGGASLREIAALVGLTHVGVRRIIAHYISGIDPGEEAAQAAADCEDERNSSGR
jgi:hypothetical protein